MIISNAITTVTSAKPYTEAIPMFGSIVEDTSCSDIMKCLERPDFIHFTTFVIIPSLFILFLLSFFSFAFLLAGPVGRFIIESGYHNIFHSLILMLGLVSNLACAFELLLLLCSFNNAILSIREPKMRRESNFFKVVISISFFFTIFISFWNLWEFFVAIILLYPRCFAICDVDCNHSTFRLDVSRSKAFNLFVIIPFCAEILLLAFSVFFCSRLITFFKESIVLHISIWSLPISLIDSFRLSSFAYIPVMCNSRPSFRPFCPSSLLSKQSVCYSLHYILLTRTYSHIELCL